MAETSDPWFDGMPERAQADTVMHVDVGGYEGPMDLLLELARKQKVDLSGISVLALAEQYLAFIETIRQQRIEIAADYLVMAAWLAYLKSRLMVPQQSDDEEPSGEEMAALLQFRLARLEAMRDAAGRLLNRSRLGRDVFARGMPEPVSITRHALWEADLYQLLRAYAAQRERGIPAEYSPHQRTVWGLQEAREILERLIGQSFEWISLDTYLADYLARPEERATAMASSFTASLELVRLGQVELRQQEAFAPLLMRRRRGDVPQ
ncbi:segregation and condensation protein A [Pelagibacterium halotolerans]|uniref:Segregation and condensation protein A n=1 Tax=Pelagibacterium halotolerans (strain DSM 22347 / JCM 15775 / CGMCC 1.7692 / B2) TaxID=1082931 RepID=G4R9T7_PELHB|nr:ScpA family protein [Pelagibacterium halotolerans]AEQ51498.1 Segregation and condensation protein A [Pelagibacterium halotolerans B2]QJR18663.1 segregation/condensation protein A [Pelagibacterium halotolerans]SEA15210.1 condensin subunit ScpA [Pelagibacterium halotolerans]